MQMDSSTESLNDIFPGCAALELDALQIDTPCIHVFKSQALPVTHPEEPEEIINTKDAEC